MRYVGLDVHQRRTTVATVDDETGEMTQASVPTAELAAHLGGGPADQRIVLEAGSQSRFVARQLMSCGWEVVVVHPGKARPILRTYGQAKTDRRDAQALAQAFARGQLDHAAIWVPGPWIADLRELTRLREQLVRQSTELRVAIRQALARWGEECPYRDLMGQRGRVWLDELEQRLTAAPAATLRHLRRVLAAVVNEIQVLSAEIEAMVRDHPDVQRLCTVIGLAVQSAAAVVAEIGEVSRFPNASHLRSYSGLVPQVKQSGDRSFTGPLTKAGNRYLRRALVLAAQHFSISRSARPLRLWRWYARLLHRRGPNPAKVALARRLLDIIFAMLREGTSFDRQRYLRAA